MVRKNNKNLLRRFSDQCVIYYSRKDELWVAHSLHTDQVGTGDNMLDALSHLLSGIRSLINLANKSSDIQVFREAPRSIQNRLDNALVLPEELSAYAHKRVRGEWPDEIKLIAEPKRHRCVATKITGVTLVGTPQN